jgi:hypothetical protein
MLCKKIYETIDTGAELEEIFQNAGKDIYSIEAYDYILDYYNCADQIELNIDEICENFIEETVDKIIKKYGLPFDDEDYNDEDELIEFKVIDYLSNWTYAVYTIDGKILYLTF